MNGIKVSICRSEKVFLLCIDTLTRRAGDLYFPSTEQPARIMPPISPPDIALTPILTEPSQSRKQNISTLTS